MFGDLVRAHRRRLGMTQEELADRAGLSVRAVGKLEGGRVLAPRPPTVRLLADALGLAGADRERFLHAAAPADDRDVASREFRADLGAGSAPRPVPAQLPPAAGTFSGREDELAALSAALTDRAGTGGTVVISAIGGAGGIGKTWLAVHWAHQHRDRFPDGQLFVNLRGFDPSGEPLAPTVAVRGFLDALGVPAQSIPVEPAARVGLYRSLLADRRMIIVLDNARDAGQVADLLPGSGTCVVLITSRDRLVGLVRSHGAHPVPMDVLDSQQSHALLERRIGPRRMLAEPQAVARIVAACGGLPLALGVVAARAAVAPELSLGAIAAELDDSATRLHALDDDPRDGLRAVLSWSYATLTPTHARVLCLLGLAPGPDISLPTAVALTHLPGGEVVEALRALQRQSLLGQPAPGRWRMHDLVRLYARERADTELADAQRWAAYRRLVDFFLHTAYATSRLLDPHRPPIVLDEPVDGGAGLTFTDEDGTWRWLEAEHAGLLAAQGLAQELGWYDAVWQLAWVTDTLHRRRGHVHDRHAVWQTALAAAERSGNSAVLPLVHQHVGLAYGTAGRPQEAVEHIQRGLKLAEQAGDRANQAHILRALGWATFDREELAFDYIQRALHLYQELDDPLQVADALNALGWSSTLLGRFEQAREFLDAALEQSRALGHRRVETETLDSLGFLAHRTGDFAEAVRRFHEALALARELGDAYSEGEFLEHLGDTYAAAGDPVRARQTYEQARALYLVQHRRVDVDRVVAALDGVVVTP